MPVPPVVRGAHDDRVVLGSCPLAGIGMWRSLVAHLTGGQGVAGSNPVIPTEKSREPEGSRDFFVRGRDASSPGAASDAPGEYGRSKLAEQRYAELSDDGPQFSEVALRLLGERDRRMADPADLDAFVNVERDGDDLRV